MKIKWSEKQYHPDYSSRWKQTAKIGPFYITKYREPVPPYWEMKVTYSLSGLPGRLNDSGFRRWWHNVGREIMEGYE